jgi:beta-1,2-mannosidase
MSILLLSIFVTVCHSAREIHKSHGKGLAWPTSVRLLACLLVGVSVSLAGAEVTARRLSDQPLLGPVPGWMSMGVFNPSAVKVGSKTVLLFRAQDARGTSRIGYAESADGLHFTTRSEPVLSPEADYERGGGVEDPRVIQIGGTYYLTYTGYNGKDAQLCLATSTDLLHWKRAGVILPAYKGTWNEQWTKSGAILPQKINGKWWMYYLGTRKDPDGPSRDYMGLAISPDLLHWTDATAQPVLPRRPGAFDSRVMEPGPAPILTEDGIYLLYNGADDHLVYRPGWILFDANDPRHILRRSEHPFIEPSLPWEKKGTVPNVIFLEGAVQSGRTITGYYGGADKYIGAMEIRLK